MMNNKLNYEIGMEDSKKTPLIFVVLLNWNGWRDSLTCLSTLDKMDYQNYKVVIVDNGSEDDSVLNIRNNRPNDVLIESGENLGFAAGCNIGIRHAIKEGADYVWLLNNDAIVEPNVLGELLQCAYSSENVGAVGAVMRYMDDKQAIESIGGGKVNWILGTGSHIKRAEDIEQLQYITGGCMFLPRYAIEKIGLLDEQYFMYWEDSEYCLRLKAAGLGLTVAMNATVYHKESGSFRGDRARKDQIFSESTVIFFCNHSRFPIIPITIVSFTRMVKRIFSFEWRSVLNIFVTYLTLFPFRKLK